MRTVGKQLGTAAFVASLAFAGMALAADPAPARAAEEPPIPQVRKPLDLRKPDVTELYTPEQIQAMLAHTRDGRLEEVEVQGERVPVTPNVWGGLAAPVWALFNPTQAWRIFAPVPPDRLHGVDVPPAAQAYERDPFRP